MFFFTKPIRYIASLLTTPLLLLVIWLLVLDPTERRPFVEKNSLKALQLVEQGCHWLKTRITNSLSESEGPPNENTITSPGESASAKVTEEQYSQQMLPSDFLAELRRAVEEETAEDYQTRWLAVTATKNYEARVELAVKLARELPAKWWPVNGELVHELDLKVVLINLQPH
jgi:hypothetical protein